VDYPGKIALTLFTSNCNFDCAYCHNPGLKVSTDERVSEEEVFEYLAKRKAQLDGVVITGGEPTLREAGLIPFILRLKELFPEKSVKLDTNGWNSQILGRFLECVDFVAMDLKAADYSLFSRVSIDSIEESLELVKSFKEHEIRVTMYPPYVAQRDFERLAILCKGASRVAIQQYRRVKGNPVAPYSIDILNEFAGILCEETGLNAVIRG